MNRGYLLVRIFDNAIVETYNKIFTSFDFACELRNQIASESLGEGFWDLLELEIDTFQTSNDLKAINK